MGYIGRRFGNSGVGSTSIYLQHLFYVGALITLIDHRRGINTAVAEVTSNGVTSTAMFFPKHNRYARQMKMYKKQWVSDFMPNVNSCNEAMEFR